MRKKKRVLAVSSGGGHWIELQRVLPALEGAEVVFCTVNEEYRSEVPNHRFYWVNDATRWDKVGLVLEAARIMKVLLLERPDVIITTGAAPGALALRLGKLIGARTIWIDSIAAVDEFSFSGRFAKPHADLCLVQWPHLESKAEGLEYVGAVL
ncbi:UDP-N-acetylglucosamine--LPS N-acetylglucosamine transferase [Myxococcota bacterium]|nr:UDP-N-acetylglucosamine--LPS N-acetylglucosamine transferase [Myxococcota bacterium]